MSFEELLLALEQHSDLISNETKTGHNTNVRVGLLGKKVAELLREIGNVDDKFLSRLNPDTAAGLITFLKGITSEEVATFKKGLETSDFSSGMPTGKGAKIDENGNAEFESIMARSFLEVPEIRHNRETVIGMEMTIGDSGIIEDVTPTADPDVFILKMKLQEGELITFWEHDILKGIFHHGTGFFTSWFRINSINQELGTVNITMASPLSIASGRNFPPKPFMHIAHRGNFIHAERQTVIYLTAYERKIIVLSGVDNYEGGVISAQLGAPTGLENILPGTLPINKNDSYLYIRGLLAQDILRINYKGAIVKEIVDRGQWSLSIAQSDEPYVSTLTEQHDVWIGLNKYRCIVNGTIDVPSTGSPDWILILGIEDKIDEVENKIPISWELQPISDKGVNAFNYDANGSINNLVYSVRFLRSGVDVTDIMTLSTSNLYNFERKNTFGVDDNGVTDESWNITHSGAKTITLTDSDIYGVGEIIVAFNETAVEAEYQILK